MKQTYGRVSKFGCVPLGYSLDGINPMARSAYDCALMLNVMAGYDPKDPVAPSTCRYRTTPPALTGNVAGLTHRRTDAVLLRLADFSMRRRRPPCSQPSTCCKAAGAIVKEVEVPYAAEAKDANMIIMWAEGFAYHRPDLATQYGIYGSYTSEVLARGALLSSGDYVQAQRFRSFFRKAMEKLFEDHRRARHADLDRPGHAPRGDEPGEAVRSTQASPDSGTSRACPRWRCLAVSAATRCRCRCSSSARRSTRPPCSRSATPTSASPTGTFRSRRLRRRSPSLRGRRVRPSCAGARPRTNRARSGCR